ncbi:MAG: NHLP family bacteriocin export ABC transporter peptidase/permease/ATPase subunit [Deltaproteobacteria bacterium]|nr:NHLP family bacteriocin export ABC transporter peptidase/permease/ATPase subunit [Deltaproteobacteria bacterium]
MAEAKAESKPAQPSPGAPVDEGPPLVRVNTPLLLQLEAVECGAAALGIVLEYYGRTVPLAELREACGVSRDGSKALNIMKAAERYGLKTKAFKESIQSALKRPFPFIVFWNFNHFLVVEGFDRTKGLVFLNDPAHGHRKITMKEFDESFTGVCILFEKAPTFQPGGSRPSLTDGIKKRLDKHKTAIKYLLASGLILTLPGLVIPAYTRIYLDNVLGQERVDWYKPVIAALLVTVAFKLISEAFKYLCLRRLKISLSASMSKEFIEHLLRLPLRFYSQRFAGEIASRQKLNDKLADIISGKLADTAINVMMMVFYALLMFYYNWALTLVGIAFAAIGFGALQFLSRRRKDTNMRLRQDMGKVSGDSIAALQSMETIKASGQESAFFTRWAGRYAKSLNTMMELEVATQTLTVLPPVLRSVNTAVIYLLGGLAVIEGDMSIGTLVAFTALMDNFQDPVKDMVDLGSSLQELDGDLQRLDDVLLADLDPEAIDRPVPPGEKWPLQLDGHVTLNQITFGYSPIEAPLFDALTIDIPPGKWIAFVGSSGSGKTTMANILCGLYQAWKGDILFDGHARNAIPRPLMTASFAKVSQEIFLFQGTVRENLTLWDATVPEINLLSALEDAGILEVVLALPHGLDGEVLEGGANFSGGQRQRLEIARALVHNPSILVLDEATSALDAETEAFVIERLRRRGLTCVLVAHRLSTIRDCDEIIVFDKGKIAERGTHVQLWEAGGIYAGLLKAGEAPVEEEAAA